MTTMKKLSAAQLNKIIDKTQAELTRRKNIDAAMVEIWAILKKYKIGIQDIDLNVSTRASARKSAKKVAKGAKARDRRSTVQAKYKDPNSPATWSGRGRTPVWVRSICQNEDISIEVFKKDDRFRC